MSGRSAAAEIAFLRGPSKNFRGAQDQEIFPRLCGLNSEILLSDCEDIDALRGASLNGLTAKAHDKAVSSSVRVSVIRRRDAAEIDAKRGMSSISMLDNAHAGLANS